MVVWHPRLVDVLRKLVGRPSPLTIIHREVEVVNAMAIESRLAAIDDRIVTIYPHRLVVVRNRKGENPSMEFPLTFDGSEQLDDASDGQGHAVRVLPVRDIQTDNAAFDFGGEEGKVHPPRREKEGSQPLGSQDVAGEGFQLPELIGGKCRTPESHTEVGLWRRRSHRNRFGPAFVKAHDQFLQFL